MNNPPFETPHAQKVLQFTSPLNDQVDHVNMQSMHSPYQNLFPLSQRVDGPSKSIEPKKQLNVPRPPTQLKRVNENARPFINVQPLVSPNTAQPQTSRMENFSKYTKMIEYIRVNQDLKLELQKLDGEIHKYKVCIQPSAANDRPEEQGQKVGFPNLIYLICSSAVLPFFGSLAKSEKSPSIRVPLNSQTQKITPPRTTSSSTSSPSLNPSAFRKKFFKWAYENAQNLDHQAQNDILACNLFANGTFFQYIRNQLHIEPRVSLRLLHEREDSFYNTPGFYDFKRLQLLSHLLAQQEDTESLLDQLLQCSETPEQKLTTLVDISLVKWLSEATNFIPTKFNSPLKPDLSISLCASFQNAEAKINKFSTERALKFYKSYCDFIIANQMHQTSKTIVGQVLNGFLRFCEKKARDQTYKPLLGLGWLNLMEKKYMIAEGLLRNVEDQLENLPNTVENQAIKGQMIFWMMQLFEKLENRRSDKERYMRKAYEIVLPQSRQLSALYVDIEQFPVQFE